MDIIRKLIKDFSKGVSNDELDDILTHFKTKPVSKGGYLLRENSTCRQLTIVKTGCFKVLYGAETIVWFAFERMPITEMQSFVTQKPSKFTIRAMEDSEVFVIDYKDLQLLYTKYDAFKTFGLHMTERILSKTISRATSLQFENAETRYQRLFENPNYLARIPLQDLASFLGVTPNSLSRIRSRIKNGVL